MTSRAITTKAADVNAEAEQASARVDQLLRIWEAPENDEAMFELVTAAVLALKSGEARRLAEAITAPLPDGDLARIVAELIASWPRENRDMAVMTKFMMQDVARAAPPRAALLMACRTLRATHTHPPAIAEVLAAVEVAKASCAARAALLERMPRRVQQIGEIFKEAGEHGKEAQD